MLAFWRRNVALDMVLGLVAYVAMRRIGGGTLDGGPAAALYGTVAQVSATILALSLVPIGALLTLDAGRRLAAALRRTSSGFVRQTLWAFLMSGLTLVAAVAGLGYDPDCGPAATTCSQHPTLRALALAGVAAMLLALTRLAWSFAAALRLVGMDHNDPLIDPVELQHR